MRIKNLLVLITSLAQFASAAQTNQAVIFPGDTAQTLNLVWPATPGLRYEVKESTNLQSWTTARGYPAPAFGPAQQMPFSSTDTTHFYKVNQLDDQPPVITTQYPADGGFAVPRFANLTLQLVDATGIDTNSLQLTISSLGTFTLTNAQLTFSNGILTFLNGGSIPLGGWASNVTASLVMADTLGHFATNTWSFTLESQPQTVTNLFVFGSPHAQRTGQQIGNIPTRVLAARAGPIAAGAGDPWTLALVATNYLVLSYTNTAPGFTVGQYVCNLTPASPAEIFNRKITAVSDDPANKLLTLGTVEVPLTEIATNGSASVSSDSMILQMDTNGVFNKAFSISGTVTFPRIGYSLDGAEFKLRQNGYETTFNGSTLSLGDPPDLLHVTAQQLHWWLTPSLKASVDVNWGKLTHFEAIASGTVDQAAIFDADVLLAGVYASQSLGLPDGAKPALWVFLGSIGPVPVFASLGFDMKLVVEEQAQANLSFHAGESQSVSASFGVTYNRPSDVAWVHDFNFPSPTIDPFKVNLTAAGSIKISLKPAVEFLVYGLAGVSAGITPSEEVDFQTGIGQPLTGDFKADVSLDLGLAGPALEPLNLPDYSLSLWSDQWHLFPNPASTTGTALAFDQQPQSQTVTESSSAYFSCSVSSSGTPSYQWYFGGVPMPGQTSRTLSIPSASAGHAGNYYVRVSAGGQTSNSATATLNVLPASVQSSKSGLVAWYPLNGNANDASGNGNNAIANGSVKFVSGYIDQAASFSQSWFQIPNILNNLQSFSISLWVNEQGMTNAGPGDAEAGGEAYIWFGDNEIQWAGIASWGGAWAGVGDTNVAIVATVNDAAGQPIPVDLVMQKSQWRNHWHHLVMTYDSQQASRSLFIDGVFINQRTASKATSLYGVGAIASHTWWYGTNRNYRLLGQIDDVRIYNRALSTTDILSLYNASLPAPAPSSGMANIPAGSFQMGDAADNNYYGDAPVHTVYVSAFYMDKNDVTEGLWAQVYNWAVNQGYSFDYPGSVPGSAYSSYSKGANYPVIIVNWYDTVKWCNARSEMEGRTPAYYTTSAQTVVYRAGQVDVDNNSVNWNAGYRLPTEAE